MPSHTVSERKKRRMSPKHNSSHRELSASELIEQKQRQNVPFSAIELGRREASRSKTQKLRRGLERLQRLSKQTGVPIRARKVKRKK